MFFLRSTTGFIMEGGKMLRVVLFCSLVITANCFVLNGREKRTVKIPAQLLEPLVPVLQKILPEPKLMQIQGLLTKEKLVAEEGSDEEFAVSEDSMAEQMTTGGFAGLPYIQDIYTGFLMQ